MKAAYLTGVRKIEIREASDPSRVDGNNVIMRVGAVGVCGSDIHYFKTGRIGSAVVQFPFILGHECAGTIVATGPEAKRFKPGQRVAVDPLVSCGECDQCRQHRRHTCRNQRFLGMPGQLSGSLVELLVMPEECCYLIPDSLTTDQAAMVEPLSIGLYAVRLAGIEPGANVAILGAGPIGLSTLLASRALANCNVYVTDLLPERLRLARQLGAVWSGSPQTTDIVREIRNFEPYGVDWVFECAGEQETLNQGVELLKPGGTLLVIGIPESDRVSFPIHTLRRKELTVRNVRRQNDCIVDAMDLIASGQVDVSPLMTHAFPMAESQAAFDLVAEYRDGVMKALIRTAEI